MNFQPQPVHVPQPARGRIEWSGLSGELRIRYIAQSILTGILDKPEVPTLQEARDIISWANAAA